MGILLKMVGNGVKREELTSRTWLYEAREEGCSTAARSAAEFLVRRKNR